VSGSVTAVDRRLLSRVPVVRGYVLLGAAIGVATALLVIVQAGLLAHVVADAFLGGEGLGELAPPLVGLLVVVAARAVLGWAGEAAAHRAAAAAVAQVRATLLDHVLRLGPRHPGLPGAGQLATLATRGVDGLDGYVGRYLPQLLVAAVVPLVVGVRILTADWVSALLVGVTVGLIPLFMVLIGLHTRSRTGRQWRALAVLGHHFLDVVAGLDVLTAYGRARRQGRAIAAMSERYRAETMRGLRVAFLSSLVLEVLATLSVALVAVAAGLRLVDGQLDLATGLLVIMLAPEVYLPLRAVAARFHDSAEGAAAADAVFTVLDLVPAEPEAATAVAAPHPAAGPVRLDGVGVDGRAGPVLEAVTVEIAPGEVLGVSGPSGAGKSTLLDLLLGWRRPDHGTVSVDGVDLAAVDRDAWLHRVAWLPQRPVLVAGTVADNLRLGAPNADHARLTAAAAAAALDIPLATAVHEHGRGLSTGQQRRVALARALVADRPLLLLDEPTEGVDAETEAALLARLPAALAGRTAVVVSHRPAVLGLCHRVVALPGRSEPAPAAPVSAARTDTAAVLPDPAPAEPRPGAHCGGRDLLLGAIAPHCGRLALAVLAGSGALGCAVALTATSAWLISAAALHPPVLTLIVAIAAVRLFGLAKGVLRYAERLASHDVALRLLATLRVRLWATLVRLGPAVTGRLRSGELLARLVGDIDAQQDAVVRALVPVASAAVVGIGTAAALGALLPGAGLALAAGLLCAGVVAPAVTVRLARLAALRTAAARGAVVAAVVELLDGAADLLACGCAADRRSTVATLDARLATLQRRSASATGLGVALTVLAVGGATLACTALGVAAVRAGALPGTALAVLALTPLACAELVAALPDAAGRMATLRPAARRLAELERAPAAACDPARPRTIGPQVRELAARELAVRWPDAGSDAVTDVELMLRAGQRLVLTGPTGCGKTTLLAALMRNLDPRTGAVLLEGVDAREIRGDEVREHIAWCGPSTHLFDSTLRQNLLLARPDATDREIIDALRLAGLGRWLDGLPEGLATQVGRHGGAVSGGERQRIGLARVLLADRQVLLLDEPTAHLDAGTAARVSADLLRATAGRTVLVVTHRPAELPGLPQVRLPGRPTSAVAAPAPRSRHRARA
jgi:ATP-binding cassette subfamily C protein CydCD